MLTIHIMVYRKTKITTSPLIKANHQFIKTLAASRSLERRKHLLQSANRDQLLTLVEIALNLLRNRIPIRANQKHRLQAQASSIRRLSRARSERTARQVLLNSEHQQQQGKGPVAIAGLVSKLLIPFLVDLL